MEWVVTTGRTVEEAIEAALDELGVDEADAEVEVLTEPKQGLFGRLRTEARVRARVRPTAPRPKVERRDRRRRPGRDERPRPARDRAAAGSASAEPDGSDATDATETAPPGRSRSGGSPARSRGGRSRSGRGTREATGAEPTPAPAGRVYDDEDEESSVIDEQLSLSSQGEAAREFLEGLLARFGVQAEMTVVEIDEETVEVRIEGPELGLLIGPKGQTLAAIQELSRTVVQHRQGGRAGRLLIDVAGYRQRRKEALERFTRQVAEDVVNSGVQKVLEPMSPADRKIVHDTANDIAGVRTTSEGEEPRRRVVILPDAGERASSDA